VLITPWRIELFVIWKLIVATQFRTRIIDYVYVKIKKKLSKSQEVVLPRILIKTSAFAFNGEAPQYYAPTKQGSHGWLYAGLFKLLMSVPAIF
jgi:membrane protein CcdC involved in cytochrome C biogenesis